MEWLAPNKTKKNTERERDEQPGDQPQYILFFSAAIPIFCVDSLSEPSIGTLPYDAMKRISGYGG